MSEIILGLILIVQIIVVVNLWNLNRRMDTVVRIANEARRLANDARAYAIVAETKLNTLCRRIRAK